MPPPPEIRRRRLLLTPTKPPVGGGGGDTITPSGIASAEAFGSHSVSFTYAITGVASAEVFGTATIRFTIAPTGIPTAEVVNPGTGSEGTTQTGIPSSEAFGTATQRLGTSLTGIPTGEAFGAPMLLLCSVDRRMGPPQWSDLGMFLQTLMLLLTAEGIDSCAQESWSIHPRTVGGFVGLPPERMLFTGMAIGYANPANPVNALVADRAPLEAFARFHGI